MITASDQGTLAKGMMTLLLPESKRRKLKNRRDPIPSNIPSEEASEDAAPAVEKEDGR